MIEWATSFFDRKGGTLITQRYHGFVTRGRSLCGNYLHMRRTSFGVAECFDDLKCKACLREARKIEKLGGET